jgi:hypothetical protein
MKLTILLETPTVIGDNIAIVEVKLVFHDHDGSVNDGTGNRAFSPFIMVNGKKTKFKCYDKRLTAGFEISYAGCAEPVRVRACIMHWKSTRFLIPAELGEWFGSFSNSAVFLDKIRRAYNEMERTDPNLPLWPRWVRTAPFVKSSDLNKTDEW